MNALPDDRPLDESALELAALYALSALAPEEMETVERQFRASPAFWVEVRSLGDAAAGIAASGPRAKPRRDLWPEIRARVLGVAPAATVRSSPPPQVWKHWQAKPTPGSGTPGIGLVPADENAFEPTDIAGIEVRRLFIDDQAERVTMLVRMAPGTAYPAHRHDDVEECFVLSGDLTIGGRTTLHAGDYQRMDKDSVHAVQSTREGCLLFITSSRRDELL